jgi:tetratricopeptide (TPR) repeat protein
MDPERAKQIANECWKSGSASTAKENWEYAVEMFSKAVTLVPDNLAYRQSLRGAEYRKFNNNGSGARMAGAKLMGVRSRVKKAKGKEDWKTMDEEAEKGLQVNPWDPQLEAWVGEACSQMGYKDIAIFALSNAVKQEKENMAYLRVLAELHLEKRNYDEAGRLWEKIYQLDPLDGEARGMQTKIQTLKTMDRGGYEEADNTRDVKAGQTAYDLDRKKKSGGQDVIGPGDDLESDLKRQIRKTPENFEPYQKLADFYRKAKRIDECIEMYTAAHEKSGGNDDIREQLEDVQLEKLKNLTEDAREVAANNPEDEEAKKKFKALEVKLIKNEIHIYSERLTRHTQDSRLKFDLAKRYMRVKHYNDAIKLFQQSVVDTRLETDCLVLMGECFLKENKMPLAKRQFEKALPNLNPQDKKEQFLTAHYALGRIAEKAGDLEAAENHYNEILGVDYGYMDVSKRLENLGNAEPGN